MPARTSTQSPPDVTAAQSDLEPGEAPVQSDLELGETPSPDSAAAREEAIRRRAYEISESAEAGTAEENWERAERELGGADER